MSKYIDADLINYKQIESWGSDGNTMRCDFETVAYKNEIDAIPAADVRTVRYGKWVKRDGAILCSECNYDTPFIVRNFCPNCGANMRGGEPHE